MAIKGSLREASLPDVLQLLAMGKKTGLLSVTDRANFGYIFFDKGRICYASIVNRRDRLGDILVKNGLLTQEQLDAGIAAQGKQRGQRLGALLVQQGAISEEVLHQQVRVQIEEAVYFLFTWTQGNFNFEPDLAPEGQDILVSILPESLLLEGARRVDEWSLIEKKIPSFDVIFELDRRKLEESDVQLEEEQLRIADLLDGLRDVTRIIEDSGLGEFAVGKALYGLLTAGFAQRVGTSKPTEAKVSDTRVDEHRNLGIAFYKAGMLDEAMREFRRVIDLREGDGAALFYVGLVHLRQGNWPEAARTFSEGLTLHVARPQMYHNLAYALERQGRYTEARAALEEALRRGGAKDPRLHITMGVIAMRAGEMPAATEAFEAARPLFGTRPPPAVWFHFASLALAMRGNLPGAETLLQEGLVAHPRSSVLYNDLAVVRERRGDADGCRAALEQGIAEDGTLPQLHKNLGDALYRASRYDEAIESYNRAVKLDPALGDDVYLKLGNILFRRNERTEAIACWEKALELDPENAIVRTNLDAVRQVL